jgi:hypothetical protein
MDSNYMGMAIKKTGDDSLFDIVFFFNNNTSII